MGINAIGGLEPHASRPTLRTRLHHAPRNPGAALERAAPELPPAVALLVGGGALAFVPGLPVIELDPEFVMVLFLPPLLMDGAYFTAHAEFRKHLAGRSSSDPRRCRHRA